MKVEWGHLRLVPMKLLVLAIVLWMGVAEARITRSQIEVRAFKEDNPCPPLAAAAAHALAGR